MELIGKDVEMDKELRAFFNKFLLKSECDDISIKFKTLPQQKKFDIIKKYLTYFFTYSISSSVKDFEYDEGLYTEDYARLGDYGHRHYGQLYYREIAYNIEAGDTEWSYNSFNVSTIYRVKYGIPVFVAFHISVSYDLFSSGSIGFDFFNESAETQEKFRELIKRVYSNVMSNDEVHVWLMFNGMEESVEKLLLIK